MPATLTLPDKPNPPEQTSASRKRLQWIVSAADQAVKWSGELAIGLAGAVLVSAIFGMMTEKLDQHLVIFGGIFIGLVLHIIKSKFFSKL